MKKEVQWIVDIVSLVSWLLDHITIVIMLLPMIRAFLYGYRYEHDLESSNYFINGTFEEIDEERKERGRPKLLPLKTKEKKKYIRWWSHHIVTSEIPGLVRGLYLTITPIFIPIVLVAIDVLSYRILYLCYRFLHSDLIKMPKPNVYELKVSGTGFMNTLLSSVLTTFEPVNEYTDQQDTLWRSCFEEPTSPNYFLIVGMFFTFIFCILLCFLKIYAKRARQFIMAFYYPEMTFKRAEFLYRKIYYARHRPKLPQGVAVIVVDE